MASWWASGVTVVTSVVVMVMKASSEPGGIGCGWAGGGELAVRQEHGPRTDVGKTSPWISQPVPPTPIANEVMKNEKPTMTTTVFGRSVKNATPAAATSMNTAMPA